MLHRMFAVAVLGVCTASAAWSQTIYPIDRAAILTGAVFDVKIEFPGLVDAASASVTVDGRPLAAEFGRDPVYVAREDDKDQSALLLRDVKFDRPGLHTVSATDGVHHATVTWEVYDTSAPRAARNVILFVGDGMSMAHRTAARILSRGITEGRYHGKLEIDEMPHMALVTTSGVDSIVTDSANSASAYTTGHKASNNALGVYADRTANTSDDPRVENVTSLVQRRKGMSVGVVTNTEIEDATPASMVAHTRRRAEYDTIIRQFLQAKPEVIMGGGSAHFLPKSVPGSKRSDEEDLVAKFRDAGYRFVGTAAELNAAGADAKTGRLLGLFNLGNMDGALDRRILKKGSVEKFPDQPDLTEEVRAALSVLSRNPKGFVLLVESGLIDKYTHVMDWERAVYDTIMLDNAVKVAKDFAGKRNDTLVMVVADHTQGISLIGTFDNKNDAAESRDRIGVYEAAGYPNYPAPDEDHYPPTVDVAKRLVLAYGGHPDYYETYKPKLDGPNVPAITGQDKIAVANEKYKDVKGAYFQPGTIPRANNQNVHAADDVILTAMGPGSDRVHGQLENVDVFRIIAEALALGRD